MNKAHLELVYRKFHEGSLTKTEAMLLLERLVGTPSTDCRLHPLVHHNVSTLAGLSFSSRFDGREFFLRDHRVQGQRVLPGAAYCEIARVVLGLVDPAQGKHAVLRGVTWTAPLVVTEPVEMRVHIKQDGESDRLGYQITTDLADGEHRIHGAGTVFWGEAGRVPTVDLDHLRSVMGSQRVSGDACYRRFAAIGIEYGPVHRAVQSIWKWDDGVLAELKLNAETATLADYTVHPALLDAAQQAAIVLMEEHGDGRPALPFAVDGVDIYGPCQQVMWAWIRPSAAGDKRDIDLCDPEGRVCVRYLGLAARPVRAESSRMLGDDSARTVGSGSHSSVKDGTLLFSAPAWQVVEPTPTPAAAAPMIVGGSPDQEAALLDLFPEARVVDLAGETGVAAMSAAFEQQGLPEHLLWIAPEGEPLGEAMVTAQDVGVMNLFRLIQALLINNAGSRPLELTVITRQTLAVGDEAIDATHAAVHGLVGSLAKEYPEWAVRLIDVPLKAPVSLDTLLAVPADSDGKAWVWRDRQWWRRDLLPLAVPEQRDAEPYRMRGTYVVVGGAGGLGLAWSKHLAATTEARLVWIGRRPVDETIQAALDEVEAVGPRPLYIQADATRVDALRGAYEQVHAALGPIHGVVHAALVLKDQVLANMSEVTFRAALAAKLDVAVNMAAVFGDDALDFMLFFSSLNAFNTSPGQANYAAACTAKDALALQLGQQTKTTVKIMNWGYWGGVGRVADPFYHQQMNKRGIASIQPDEGWSALADLLRLPTPVAAVAKVTEAPTPADLPDERLLMLPARTGADAASLAARLNAPPSEAMGLLMEAWQALAEDLDRQLVPLLWDTLDRLDLLRENAVPAAGGWFGAWLTAGRRLLAGHAMAGQPEDREALWRRWSQTVAAADAGQAAQFKLVDVCLRALPDVLQGRVQATEVLFPNSSTELVEAVYAAHESARLFHEGAAKAVLAAVEERVALNADAKVRILEIGAGTGSTTDQLLTLLKPLQKHVAEYAYTDISKAFLNHGETHFAADFDALQTKLFDVTRSPEDQQIDVGGYDIVLATNVLHATPDMRTTVRHSKALLQPGGVLVLNEMSRAALFTHLTFGLLEGWWCFEDPALRLPGCPGLSPQSWRALLVQEGFAEVLFPLAWAETLGSQVIVAQSNGVLRLKRPLQAAPQAVAAEPVAVPVADGALATRATKYLQKLVAEALKMKPHQLDPRERLEHYGLDSILSVQLTNRLGKVFDNISSTLFFEVPTVEALVAELLERQPAKLAELLGDAPNPTTAPPSKPKTTPKEAPRATQPHPTEVQLQPGKPVAEDAVAIIGLNGRFPMAADCDAFWENLKNGRDCISEVPAERWDMARYYDPEPHTAGKTHCRWGGFIDDVAAFDPLFFNISPREAQMMDPKERLFLETVWHLFEGVGLTRAAIREQTQQRVGVYVGAMYQQMHAFRTDTTGESLLSLTSYASIANRVSQFFDFQGPSLAVDTMCSSSLVAVHLACESLLKGETALAVAGGVNLSIHPKKYLGLSASNMIGGSADSRSFAEGDGYLPAEAVAAVLLKPLAQAEADGDRIMAVIKASSLNHGGAGTGYSVPNPQAQRRLIRENLAKAGVAPETIGYVESAANGSPLGDAIEVNALRETFPAQNGRRVALGSVKTQIGHAEAASGMTQLAKAVLQLQHRQLVPNRVVGPRNPKIDLNNSPFYIPDQLESWEPMHLERDGRMEPLPRRAALSSFGAAGANAHLVLEEYITEAVPAADAEPHNGPYLVPLSAKDADRLPLMAARLAEYLAHRPDVSLAAIAHSLQKGREAMPHRLAMVVDSTAALLEGLARFARGDEPEGALLFQGTTESRHRIADLLAGEAGRTFVDTLVAQNDLAKLADLWVQGADVPWPSVAAPDAALLSLPVYPFQRHHTWIDSQGEPAPTVASKTKLAGDGAESWLTWLQQEVGAMLGLSAEQVKADKPLVELGFGSLNGVHLKAALEKHYGVSLPTAVLAGFNTAAAIARELEQQVGFVAGPEAVPEATLPVVVPNPAERYQPFPLSDIQASYLIGRKLSGVSCHIYLELNAAGIHDETAPLDLYRLNGAWKTLVAHHDMLRTIFRADGNQQVLPEAPPYEFKVRDLRRTHKAARERTLAEIRARMAHQVHPADQWPLFEIRVSICPQHTVIHFSIDELLLDWSGLEMLFQQWHAHYSNPELVRPAPAVTFRDYMVAVKNFEATPRFRRDLAYHLNRVRHGARGPVLPHNPVFDARSVQPRTRLAATLAADQWDVLKGIARRLEASPTALLLSLFREVLHAWSDGQAFLLILTYVNRAPLHPDLAAVLAPFISTSLFAAEAPTDHPEETVRATQHQLWRDLDHDGVSGIRVLRELKKEAGVAKDVSLPVVFTSLLGRETKVPTEPMFAEVGYALTQTPGVTLDHQVHEREGELIFNWDVVAEAYAPGAVEAMFTAYETLLHLLAADPDRLCDGSWRADLRTEKSLATVLRHDPASRRQLFPLTDQQQAYAFGRSKFGGNLSSQITMVFEAEHLDVVRLNQAWNQVIDRHDMLRAVIHPNGTQTVPANRPDYHLSVTDLRGLTPADTTAGLRAIEEVVQSRLVPLGDWPMFEVHVALLDENKARLVLGVDMIIADGSGINQLAREWFTAYAEGTLSEPAPAIGFRDVVMHFEARKNTPAHQADVAYWRNKFLSMPGGPNLPRLADHDVTATQGFEHVLTEWAPLKQRARELGVAESMILLAAYAEVLAAWSGGEPFGLVVPCWQRPRLHADIDRVVGDFTTMSWVAVRPGTQTFAAKVQAYHQTVQDDLDHAGVSGLTALRKAAAKRAKQDPLAFPVVFTNMGGATHFDLPEGVRFIGYQSQTSRVHMDNISLETGDALKCKWDVACDLFPDGMVAAMFAGYQRVLAALAAFPEVWQQTDLTDLIRAQPERYRRASDARTPAMEEV